MEVIYKAGTRKTFEGMDIESQCAVREAVEFVKDKRAIAYGAERCIMCVMVVSFGHNIYGTRIELYPVSEPGQVYAFYKNGRFFDYVTSVEVVLI